VEGMGTVDPVQEAEFAVSRPARPRDKGDRGPLSRAARAEHAARSLHRLGDVPDQPVRGKEDDVHDRQGGGEPRRIVAGHLGNRSVLRNRELRPRDSGVRGGARGEGVLSAEVFDKRDGQAFQGNRDEVAELPRKVCHDDSIRAVALQDGLEEPGGHRTGGRLVGLRFQRAKGDLEEVRKFRLRKNGSRPRWTMSPTSPRGVMPQPIATASWAVILAIRAGRLQPTTFVITATTVRAAASGIRPVWAATAGTLTWSPRDTKKIGVKTAAR